MVTKRTQNKHLINYLKTYSKDFPLSSSQSNLLKRHEAGKKGAKTRQDRRRGHR